MLPVTSVMGDKTVCARLTLTFILDTLTHLLVQAGEQCVQYKGKCLWLRAREHTPCTLTYFRVGWTGICMYVHGEV